MWFRQCDNPQAFERLYESAEGLHQVRLFEVTLRPDSHLRLRLALPRFPDRPPARWDAGATEAQVVVDFWCVEELKLAGWSGESAGALAVEREAGALRVTFVSDAVRLEARSSGARIGRFSAYATWPEHDPGGTAAT